MNDENLIDKQQQFKDLLNSIYNRTMMITRLIIIISIAAGRIRSENYF